MFYTDGKLQYPVRIEAPKLILVCALQQATGGAEGEIHVLMQYLFRGWRSRGPTAARKLSRSQRSRGRSARLRPPAQPRAALRTLPGTAAAPSRSAPRIRRRRMPIAC
ncbi:manganese catalase family protein [Siccirubricoccus deserti]|uniref:Manganese catalase family protein n=1 Tax=Siccirubricoccus deserti TaxID=2013562 RepID=A0A9X0QZS3_9PROT|nr:manganese catalase family protein [Siccirubricoccus deserti]